MRVTESLSFSRGGGGVDKGYPATRNVRAARLDGVTLIPGSSSPWMSISGPQKQRMMQLYCHSTRSRTDLDRDASTHAVCQTKPTVKHASSSSVAYLNDTAWY